MYIIGDVHGKFLEYYNILLKLPINSVSLQLGDFGLGFAGIPDPKPLYTPNHKFFRGNHDNPQICKSHPNYAIDYGMWNGVFIVAGADSIDKQDRTPGISWWPDEQLSLEEMKDCLEQYMAAKPDIIISHDAPFKLYHRLCRRISEFGPPHPTATSLLLNEMYMAHQPKLWVFGHWHQSKVIQMEITKFVCLSELEVFEIL